MNHKEAAKTSRSSLVRSCAAAKILGVSREYVRQLVTNKVLPPKYLFNADSWRKVYIFDKKLVERFSDRTERKKIKWKEPEPCNWMTAVELSKAIGVSVDWVHTATKKGFLVPEIVIASSRQSLRLYDKAKALEILKVNMDRRVGRRGRTQSTLKTIERIKVLHAKGMNDSHIAIKLKSTQPFISKLRKELGLMSNARIIAAQRRAALEQQQLEKQMQEKQAAKKATKTK